MPRLSYNPGIAYTGLATVGYKLLAASGGTAQARTTTGVTETPAASGIYAVNAPEVATAVEVLWDIGVAPFKYATEPLPAAVADAVLGRDMASARANLVLPPQRSLINGLARLTNKSKNLNNVLSVYAEDDTTVAYTAALTGDATALPVVELDPN